MRALRRLLTDLFLARGAGAKDLVSGPGVEAGMRACCRRGALKLPQRTQREEKHAHKRIMELLLLSLFCSYLLPIMSSSSALI
ncbi:unnamed protein product [Sphagnum jensenii]|uniref:Uncharacterized protein n=1 Tax=Sphagnum jensenii TaxID=128206 RepID=A0ABP1AUD7_9BRYO